MRAALRRPSADLKGTTSPPQYEQAVREAMTILDGAVERVVPKERRTSLAFRARVLADLLTGVASEYEEAYKAGKVTQLVEYQDAYAFFRRAQAVHRDLAPSLRAKNPAQAGELDAQLAGLARALPGLTPAGLAHVRRPHEGHGHHAGEIARRRFPTECPSQVAAGALTSASFAQALQQLAQAA